MRIYNLAGRLALGLDGGTAVDVETASGGRFSADVQAVFGRWGESTGWARGCSGPAGSAIDSGQLGPPVPRPPQVFGIGLNYRDHAAEAGSRCRNGPWSSPSSLPR